jgi:lipoprotein NlpI
MTLPPGSSPRPSPVAAIVLTGIALVLYAFMLMNAAAAPDLESIDKGVATIYALIALVLLWLVLSVLLIVGGSKGEMSIGGAVAAFILHPLSGAAAFASLFLLSGGSAPPHWPIILMIVLPPLSAAYALWAHFPAIHRLLPPLPTELVLWGIVLVLSVGQISYVVIHDRRIALRSQEEAMEYQHQVEQQEAARQQANLEKFQRLTPDSPLADWQDFIGKGNVLEKQAVAGARALTHRQRDAEAMLDTGDGFPLFHIGELDLHATPEFCASAGNFLVRNAAANKPTSPDQLYVSAADRFDAWLPAMQWLARQHCDLDAAVTAMEQSVSAYPASPERDKFLDELARMHPQWLACDGTAGLAYTAQIDACTALLNTRLTSANEAIALFNRGGAYIDNAQYDAAIPDYDAAIKINPDFAAAYNNRGNAYDDKGEHDRAIQDYDQAIRIAPGFAIAFNNRGSTRTEQAAYDQAITDFDQAIQLAPRYYNAFMNRGRAQFFRGNFTAAVDDFGHGMSVRPGDAYAALWRYLAHARSGATQLDELRRDVASVDLAAWPGPIISAYLGEQDAAGVLEAARKGDADNACDAYFYLGERNIVIGDTTAARALLQQARAECPLSTHEHYEAGAELARLAP